MTALTSDPPTTARRQTTRGLTVYGCDPAETTIFRELAPRYHLSPILAGAAPAPDTAYLAARRRCVSISHKTPVSNETLLAWSRAGVGFVSSRSVGLNHLDVEYAASLGLTVGTVSYSPDSVADFTLMQMLMLLRGAAPTVRAVAAGDFRLGPVRGRELRDLTVGVVGTGRIGEAVVRRLAGFGSNVLTYDLDPGARGVDLTDLLRRSDIVTLHVPLTADTHHLLDHRQIAAMKPGAIVVNTGRGGLIETSALVRALETGHLGGAALDVIEGEGEVFYADHTATGVPHLALGRLQQMPNVLITPHTAYYTDHALRDTVENTLINCVAYERAHRHV